MISFFVCFGVLMTIAAILWSVSSIQGLIKDARDHRFFVEVELTCHTQKLSKIVTILSRLESNIEDNLPRSISDQVESNLQVHALQRMAQHGQTPDLKPYIDPVRKKIEQAYNSTRTPFEIVPVKRKKNGKRS
jgi:hypothetical protein